jgi:LysM repeat protein
MNWRNTQLVAIGVVLMLGTALLALPGSALAANQAGDPAPNATLGLPNCSYTVRRGDTLFAIAVRNGTNVYALAALNGLYNPNFIYMGMVLRVPCSGATNPPGPGDGQPPSGICTYYLVRPGDYLKTIAARYATTWQAIAQVNRLYNPNWIYPGMRLAIPCVTMPPPGRPPWTFTSVKHHYVVNYPADWTINVQTSAPGRDPEYVYLRPATANLPMVEILALKDAPPITGFESCNKNLIFRGVGACSISLPRGQQPAQQLLVFQKGESYYHLAIQYEVQQQLAVFEEIVKSFQFTP